MLEALSRVFRAESCGFRIFERCLSVVSSNRRAIGLDYSDILMFHDYFCSEFGERRTRTDLSATIGEVYGITGPRIESFDPLEAPFLYDDQPPPVSATHICSVRLPESLQDDVDCLSRFPQEKLKSCVHIPTRMYKNLTRPHLHGNLDLILRGFPRPAFVISV